MAEIYKDGDYIYDTHWLALMRAVAGNAIFSGLAPSVVSGMTTRLATGSYYASGVKVTVAAVVDSVHSAADPTYDRWDLIWGTSVAQGKTEGTPSIAPAPPDLPAGAILLYMVRIRGGITTILTGDLYEFGFSSSLMEHASRHATAGIDPVTPAAIGAEPAFSKNTAFNKNFGTGTTNVVEIGATLVASRVVETDGSAKIISVVKNTAYNATFGSNIGHVPAIGSSLAASSIVETNASSQLITATKGTSYNKSFETSTANIKMNGAVSVGALATIARADHIHPTDTSRAPTDHSSTGSAYGWGTTGVFGHLKVGAGIDVASGVISLSVHDHTYHTNRTRRIFVPASVCKLGGTAVYAETTTPSGYIVHGVKFSAVNDYIYTTIPWKENISSLAQTPKVYICYAQEGCCVGYYVEVKTQIRPLAAGTPLSASFYDEEYANLTMECSPDYVHKEVAGWTGTSLNWSGQDALLVRVVCQENKTIWITGLILEYIADE